jgi:folate-binding protein YgfZ
VELATDRNVEFPGGSAIDATNPLLSQLRAGIPHVFPETHEAFVAQMLNLDLLGGISFEKGCYTGQEIIARAHFRGAVKRRMFRFAANCTPPAPAHKILSNGEHAGDVVYAAETSHGCELLAVISLAHADSALMLGPEIVLSKLPLPYSTPS